MDEVDEVKELDYLEEANFEENNEELEEKVAHGWSCSCGLNIWIVEVVVCMIK